jgi:hypothetical protein
MFSDVAALQSLRQRMRGMSILSDSGGDDLEKLDPREGANNVTGSGPATNFRSAATEGVTTWGPVMGGVVAVGGTVAIIGSMLPAEPYYQNSGLS